MRILLFILLAGLLPAAPAETEQKPAKPAGMVLIPAGEFTMGRTRETADDKTGMRPQILLDDRPVHRVHLDAYYIDTHEVTHAEYNKFVSATGRKPPYHWLGGTMPKELAKTPIYNVNWDDAHAYCEWTGKRLPTEAEWEKAARGTLEGKDFPWGDAIAASDAHYNSSDGPVAVGQFKANAYGIYDIVGNVSEWCADWFDREYYSKSPAKNPAGPDEGKYRIIRGGAWSDGPRRLTVFFRNWVRPNQTTPNIGFRCIKPAEQ